MALTPRQPVPDLDLPLVGGGRFRLSQARPDSFTMLVFYRGLHCPICKPYLRDLDRKIDAFAQRGVEAVAISSDGRERAERTRGDWGLKRLPLAYDLPLQEARAWGLYVSSAIKEGEPDRFSEPGLFLVRPDRTLYAATVQTMPFARPHWDDLLGALDFVLANSYPARGES